MNILAIPIPNGIILNILSCEHLIFKISLNNITLIIIIEKYIKINVLVPEAQIVGENSIIVRLTPPIYHI